MRGDLHGVGATRVHGLPGLRAESSVAKLDPAYNMKVRRPSIPMFSTILSQRRACTTIAFLGAIREQVAQDFLKKAAHSTSVGLGMPDAQNSRKGRVPSFLTHEASALPGLLCRGRRSRRQQARDLREFRSRSSCARRCNLVNLGWKMDGNQIAEVQLSGCEGPEARSHSGRSATLPGPGNEGGVPDERL